MSNEEVHTNSTSNIGEVGASESSTSQDSKAEPSPMWFPSVKQLLFAGTVIIITQLIVLIWGTWLPYSAYFRLDVPLLLSRLRIYRTSALSTLGEIRSWQSEHRHPHPLFAGPRALRSQKMCVGILTRRRNDSPPGLLSQCITSLISRMPLSYEQDAVRITVFNADPEPAMHEEAGSISDVVRVEELAYPEDYRMNMLRNANYRVRDMLDYAAMLRRLYAQGCEYGVALDDDIIAGRGWAERLLGIAAEYGPDPGWVTLRLLANFDWMGWNTFSPNDIGLLLSMAASLTIIAIMMFYGIFFLYKRIRDDGEPESKASSIPFGLLLLINFIVALVLVGRPNVVRHRPGVHSTDTQFGAVANMYPRPRLLEYASLLEEHVDVLRMQGGAFNLARRRDDFFSDLRDILEQRSAGLVAMAKRNYLMLGSGFWSGGPSPSVVGWWTWFFGNCYLQRPSPIGCGSGYQPQPIQNGQQNVNTTGVQLNPLTNLMSTPQPCVPSLPYRAAYWIGAALGLGAGAVKSIAVDSLRAPAIVSRKINILKRKNRYKMGQGPRAFLPDLHHPGRFHNKALDSGLNENIEAERLPVGEATTYKVGTDADPIAGSEHRPNFGRQPWGPSPPGMTKLKQSFGYSPYAVGTSPKNGWWGSIWRGTWYGWGRRSWGSCNYGGYRLGHHHYGLNGGERYSISLLTPSVFQKIGGIISPLTNRPYPFITIAYDFVDNDQRINFQTKDFLEL